MKTTKILVLLLILATLTGAILNLGLLKPEKQELGEIELEIGESIKIGEATLTFLDYNRTQDNIVDNYWFEIEEPTTTYYWIFQVVGHSNGIEGRVVTLKEAYRIRVVLVIE